jgi:hypothetical protein
MVNSFSRRAVEQFADRVGVTRVPGGLVDEVDEDEAEIRAVVQA